MKEPSTGRLSIRINSEVKQQASEILEELGLDLSSAVNVFLRQVINDNGLPFQPNLEIKQMVAVDSLLDMIAEAKAEGGNHTLDEIKKGADVKIMDRFFRHRELPDSENFSKPGFHLKTA